MKNICVQAYFQGNLGDDLFVLQLAKRYPNVRFYAYALGQNQNAFRKQHNIILPSFWDRILRKLTHVLHLPRRERFDGQGVHGTAVIGGSIFWEGAPLNYLNKKCVVIGANCEDSYSAGYRQKLEKAFSGVYSCCFRDKFSYDAFCRIPTVQYAPDVLYDWQNNLPRQQGRGIGISVVGSKGVFREEGLRQAYYAAIARLCDLCTEQDIPVKLLGFCESEGDGEAMESIRKLVSNKQALSCIQYTGNVEAMLGEMNRCETVVATRFHAMILGWVLGKNVVPILYSSKQTHVLEDAGFAGPMWDALHGQQLSGEDLMEMVRKKGGRLDISSLKERSRQQFAGLDRFLGV